MLKLGTIYAHVPFIQLVYDLLSQESQVSFVIYLVITLFTEKKLSYLYVTTLFHKVFLHVGLSGLFKTLANQDHHTSPKTFFHLQVIEHF